MVENKWSGELFCVLLHNTKQQFAYRLVLTIEGEKICLYYRVGALMWMKYDRFDYKADYRIYAYVIL